MRDVRPGLATGLPAASKTLEEPSKGVLKILAIGRAWVLDVIKESRSGWRSHSPDI